MAGKNGGSNRAAAWLELHEYGRPLDSGGRVEAMPDFPGQESGADHMTQIEHVQRRLREALESIGSGIEDLEQARPGPAADPAEIARLQEALEAEREANAQLEERVRAQKDKAERQGRELQAEIDRLKQELADAEIQAQRMRRTNTQLRQSIQALRESAEEGVSEPHLINQAMMSELEGLRVAREGDRAEMDAILGELKPLLEEKSDA